MKAAELKKAIKENVRVALAEDIGTGDLSAKLIPKKKGRAQVVSRETGILCGRDWFNAVFAGINKNIKISWQAKDGDSIHANQVICKLSGDAAALLSGERAALNFLQTLSGTATLTRRYVDALRGTKTKLLDTRKTLPGLRLAQKYAVHCGGGENHRLGLYDAILIKENHIHASGSVAAALETARKRGKKAQWIEIEVETLAQLEEALAAKAKRILLDNFGLQDMAKAAEMAKGRAQLEASGGIRLDNIHFYARTGVDFISIGALTKDVKALDLSMTFF